MSAGMTDAAGDSDPMSDERVAEVLEWILAELRQIGGRLALIEERQSTEEGS